MLALIVWCLVLLFRETSQNEITEQFLRRQYTFHFNHGLCTQSSRCTSTGTDCSQLCAAATAHLRTLTVLTHTWPDVRYNDTVATEWRTIEHLERTLTMARASQCKLCSNSEQLRLASIGCLDWWLRNKPTNPNWWWNQFGAPQRVGVALILLRDHLSPQAIQSGSSLLSIAQGRTVNTGQNGYWARYLMITQAALQQNLTALKYYTQMTWQYVVVSTEGRDGIQPDMSFFEHGLLQNGAYGADFVLNILTLVSMTQPFPSLRPPQHCRKLIIDYLLDGQQYMMRSNFWDWSAKGREIARPQPPRFDPTPFLDAFALSLDWNYRLAEWTALYSRWRSSSTSSSADAFQGTRYFPCSGYVVHHRARFFISLKMVSDRIRGAECINLENLRGFHLSDGVTFIQRTGQEYHGQAPTWDWQSLPGTTLPIAAETPAADCTHRHKGRSPYASAALLSSSRPGGRAIGVAAMHFIGHDFSVPTREAWSATSPIQAKKAWFLLEEGMLAMGSGITGVGEVRTTLNQVGRKGPVLALRATDIVPFLSTSSPSTAKPSWYASNTTAEQVFAVDAQRLYSQFTDLIVVHDGVVYIPVFSFLMSWTAAPRPDSVYLSNNATPRKNGGRVSAKRSQDIRSRALTAAASSSSSSSPPPPRLRSSPTRIHVVRHRNVESDWQQINGLLPSQPMTASLVKIQLLHGQHPRQASYDYAILPGWFSADVHLESARSFVEQMGFLLQRIKSAARVVQHDSNMQAIVYRTKNAARKKDCFLFAAVYDAVETVISIPCGASKILRVGRFSGPMVVAIQVPAQNTLEMTVTSADRKDGLVSFSVNRKLGYCGEEVKVQPDPFHRGNWSRLQIAVPIQGSRQGFMLPISCRIE